MGDPSGAGLCSGGRGVLGIPARWRPDPGVSLAVVLPRPSSAQQHRYV